MRLNLSRTATDWSEHFCEHLRHRFLQDFARHFALRFNGQKANTTSTLQMPICLAVLSPFFQVCENCCLIAPIWKQSNTSEAKSSLRKREENWHCLMVVPAEATWQSRRTMPLLLVSIIWDAKQRLCVPTSRCLRVRLISWDGNQCASLQSSVHGFICLLIGWRTYLHPIHLPLRLWSTRRRGFDLHTAPLS